MIYRRLMVYHPMASSSYLKKNGHFQRMTGKVENILQSFT